MRNETYLNRQISRSAEQQPVGGTVASGLMVSAIVTSAGLICLFYALGFGMLASILIAWMCCNVLVPLAAILRRRRDKREIAVPPEIAAPVRHEVALLKGSHPRPLPIGRPVGLALERSAPSLSKY